MQPYKTEFNDANSLIQSATDRMVFDTSDITKVNVGAIRGNSSAAKSDLSEAKKILDKIPANAFTGQEQADLEVSKVLINVNIELADLFEGPIADMVERTQRLNQTTPLTYTTEINEIKRDANIASLKLSKINTELNSINLDNLSPELKGGIISFKVQIQYTQKVYDGLIADLNSKCLKKCDSGFLLGADCQCHPACGSSYCEQNGVCCNGECYTPCPTGYTSGPDCGCSPVTVGSNFLGSNTYQSQIPVFGISNFLGSNAYQSQLPVSSIGITKRVSRSENPQYIKGVPTCIRGEVTYVTNDDGNLHAMCSYTTYQ